MDDTSLNTVLQQAQRELRAAHAAGERMLLGLAIAASNGYHETAARRLGISYGAFRKRAAKLGITATRKGRPSGFTGGGSALP